MRAARMYGYNQPLILEEVPIPDIQADEVLVKVGAAGMCRTDFQLVDGYFKDALPPTFPLTLGHEIAGWVDRIGGAVPSDSGLATGDLVVVVGGWGDGTCRQCHSGDEQICAHGRWPGFGPHGGYAEYVPVPHRYLIRVDDGLGLTPEVLAPLTDAGLTPYRGVKKLRQAGALGPGRTVAVLGAGGLGVYGVQYAKLLGGGATVVAFARSDEKLAIATENGADHTINTGGLTTDEVRKALQKATGRPELDAVIDCVGAEETIKLGFSLLAIQGAFASVGLVGNRIDIPLFPFVAREYSYFGSFWGNFTDLSEVVALVQEGKVKHSVERVRLDDVNDALNRLGTGDVLGRAVIVHAHES